MRRSQDILPPRQYENLEKTLLSADHLLTLINAILHLSKIEDGHMELRRVRFQLETLVDVCLHTLLDRDTLIEELQSMLRVYQCPTRVAAPQTTTPEGDEDEKSPGGRRRGV
jgi:signal transduction histidine kinase